MTTWEVSRLETTKIGCWNDSVRSNLFERPQNFGKMDDCRMSKPD